MSRPEESIPLVPRGFGGPKFLEKSQDKFLANEDENAYVQLEVFGDPPPTVRWLKVDVEVTSLPRFKSWTDGTRGLVFLGVERTQREDEGIYKCQISNRFGKREHKFKLFIARSWQEKKGPPKKEVPLYWTDVPRSKFLKEGSTDMVSFTAKLTASDRKVQWTFNGKVCECGEKYDISQAGGNFSIVIHNPILRDSGCYRCTLVDSDLSCETYLDVQLPDPEYYFLKPLPPTLSGYFNMPITLSCVSSQNAEVVWLKDGARIPNNVPHTATDSEGEHCLELTSPTASGQLACSIVRFGREGANTTTCQLHLTEYPHRITQKLAPVVNISEKEDLHLQIVTEAKGAVITWLRDGKEMLVERKRNQRLHMASKGNVHVLQIKNIVPEDGGTYTARTNADACSCSVNVAEYEYKFRVGLPHSIPALENTKAVFEVEVEDSQAEVVWYKDNQPMVFERSRLSRVQCQVSGNQRTLVIKKALPEDSGYISARTNTDTTTTQFKVKCANSFVHRLVDTAECSENSQMVFEVQVRDVFAPVKFLLDRLPVDVDGERVVQESLGQGNHSLTFKKVLMGDAGVLSCKTPSNKGDTQLECKCIFNVTEGESAPILGVAEPVTCVAILHHYSDRMNSYIHKEQCRIIVPYRIEGSRVSTVVITIEKDGRELDIGNEIQMRVKKDSIIVDVINPQRADSGTYKVTMTNSQGTSFTKVQVTVLDIPSPPRSVEVTDVFRDNVLVKWTPPKDDGGTPIKHYIVDQLDITTNNMWTTVVMSESGDDRELVVRNLAEGHRYSFRVSAANKIGESEPTDQKGPDIVTKDPWNVAEACGKTDVIDWTPTFADIVWSPPLGDGGTPITSYVIQYKETNMREWLDAVSVSVEELETSDNKYRGRCENLEEEYEYRFRVLAVNRAGRGKPGPASEPVIAMYKHIQPSLKGGGLEDMKVKEGRPIRFDVWVAGEPSPTIEWLRDDLKLVNDDDTSISHYSKKTSVYTLKNVVLSIPKALEEHHSGTYKLRLKNESGVFESVANVVVEGPPGRKKKVEEEKKVEVVVEEERKVEVVMEEDEKEEVAIHEEDKEESAEEPGVLTIINRKLSEIKSEGKDEDRDSGLKIGEESNVDTEEEEVWTEYSEDEDFYEGDEDRDQTTLATSGTEHTIVELSTDDVLGETLEDKGAEEQYESENVSEKQSNAKPRQKRNRVLDNADSDCVASNIAAANDAEAVDVDRLSAVPTSTQSGDKQKEGNTKKGAGEERSGGVKHSECTSETKFASHDDTTARSACVINGEEENMSTVTGQEYDYNNSDGASGLGCGVGYSSNTSNSGNYSQNQSEGFETKGHDESGGCIFSPSVASQSTNSHEYGSTNKEECNGESSEFVGNAYGKNDNQHPNAGLEQCNNNYVKGQTQALETEPRSDWQDEITPEERQEQDRVEREKEELIRKEREAEEELNRIKREKEESIRKAREAEEERLRIIKEREEAFQREIKEQEERLRLEKEREEARKKEIEEEEKARAARQQKEDESYVANMNKQLDGHLVSLGLDRSPNVPEIAYTNGDGCLMSLLDQMNRDDQDFKVWERDDYSFLRWYITKIMETHIVNGNSFKFIDDIQGDPVKFVERISEECVHLDEVFLQAAATIFNKDIVLIPPKKSDAVIILNGGPQNGQGKGSPFYLGYLKSNGSVPSQFYSVMPSQGSSFANILSQLNQVGNSCPIGENKLSNESGGTENEQESNCIDSRCELAPLPGSWKRMDSYTGGSSRDLDKLISDIQAEENLEELFSKLDQCSDAEDCDDDFDHADRNGSDEDGKKVGDINEVNVENLEYKGENNITNGEIITSNINKNANQENNFEVKDVDSVLDDDENEDWCLNENSNDNNSNKTEEIKNNKLEEVENLKNETNKEWDCYNYYNTWNSPTTEEDRDKLENLNGFEHVMENKNFSEEIPIDWTNNTVIMPEINDHTDPEDLCDTETMPVEETNQESVWDESNSNACGNMSDDNATDPLLTNEEETNACFENHENCDIIEKIDPTPTQPKQPKYVKRIRITATKSTPRPEPLQVNSVSPSDHSPRCECDNIMTNDDFNENCVAGMMKGELEQQNSAQENSVENHVDPFLECDTSAAKDEKQDNSDNGEKSESVTPVNMDSTDTEPQIKDAKHRVNGIHLEGLEKALATPFGRDVENTMEVVDCNGNPAQVKMRPILRYNRRSTRASYRWSGSEMCQVDGAPACPENEDCASEEPTGQEVKSETVENASKCLGDSFELLSDYSKHYQLKPSVLQPTNCAPEPSSCVKSLIDQMVLPHQDFNNVWDRDDHTFLKWYLIKQLEIQTGLGKEGDFLEDPSGGKEAAQALITQFQAEDTYCDQSFLFAFAKVFNKDLVVINAPTDSPVSIKYIKGGKKGKFGKGCPLFLGKLPLTGNRCQYISLVPDSDEQEADVHEIAGKFRKTLPCDQL